jgi:hypothetical protein
VQQRGVAIKTIFPSMADDQLFFVSSTKFWIAGLSLQFESERIMGF